MNKVEKDNDSIINEETIKEIIKNRYEDISEEEIEDIYQSIIENFEVTTEDEILEILKQAEEVDEEENVETIDETIEENDKEEQISSNQNDLPYQKQNEEIIKNKETTNNKNKDHNNLKSSDKKKDSENKKNTKEKEDNQGEEKKDKPIKQKNENSKKSKKKIIIISVIIGILLIGAIIVGYILLKPEEEKEKEKTENTTWESVLKSEAKDGTLTKKLKDELEDLDITTDEVNLMLLDIDSDSDYEITVYAEDSSKQKIFTYEIDTEIEFANDYDVSSSDDLGLVYNQINEKVYWYIDNNDEKTIISLNDKTVDQEEFDNNYYEITKQYQDEEIFDQSEEINLDEEDLTKPINEVIDKAFSNEEVLEDNNTSIKEIQEQIEEQKKAEEQAIEEEQRKKEEEEKKKEEEQKALEEEQNKQQSSTNSNSSKLKVGDYTLDYKTYTYTSEEDSTQTETLKLNSGGTCYYTQVDGQENNCTFKVANLDFGYQTSEYEWALQLTLDNGQTVVFQVHANNTLSDQWHTLK